MGYNIVLMEPEIPNNTGNIGRLCLATGSTLHLVKPFGFELDDKRVKRAGLDYWKHISIKIYDTMEEFFEVNTKAIMVFLSSHATKNYWSIPYEDDMFLVFGKESSGLPVAVTTQHAEHCYTIPMYSEYIRSLNLANAVSIVVYEGLRNL